MGIGVPGPCGGSPPVLSYDPSQNTYTMCGPLPRTAFQGSCVYADLYDYMGFQVGGFANSATQPRVDSAYGPSGLGYFPARIDTHVGPVRKLQQGWLSDLDVITMGPVAGATGPVTRTVELRPYESDPAMAPPQTFHAIEIPRRRVSISVKRRCFPNDPIIAAESYWVFWRTMEPLLAPPHQADSGVCVSLGNKLRAGNRTASLLFGDDIVSLFDHEDATLDTGETLSDPFPEYSGGITIAALGITPATGTYAVAVTYDPTALQSTDHIPQVSVSATPAAPSAPNALLTGGYIDITVTAADPAVGCSNFDGIERVEVEILAGAEGGLTCLRSATLLPPQNTWRVWLGPSASPTGDPPFLFPGDVPLKVRNVCLVQATAFTPTNLNGPPIAEANIARTFINVDHP